MTPFYLSHQKKIKSSNNKHWKNLETGNYPILQVGEGTDMIKVVGSHTVWLKNFHSYMEILDNFIHLYKEKYAQKYS